MGNIFGGMFLKLAAWAAKKSLGGKNGAQALAHAAPLLAVVSQAAGSAASVAIDQAARTNGNLAAAIMLADAAQGGN